MGLDVWFLVGPAIYFHTYVNFNSEGSGKSVQMHDAMRDYAFSTWNNFHFNFKMVIW